LAKENFLKSTNTALATTIAQVARVHDITRYRREPSRFDVTPLCHDDARRLGDAARVRVRKSTPRQLSIVRTQLRPASTSFGERYPYFLSLH
jgi:hypothetical protein